MSQAATLDLSVAQRIADKLTARRQTLAISESSAGGLISAALLSVPGASAFFLGGGVVYTGRAREVLLGLTPAQLAEIPPSTQQMAQRLANAVRSRFDADWGLAETGATGPGGNRYGYAAGHCCLAVAGPREIGRVIETASAQRMENMVVFANSALALLEQALID